MEVSRCIYWWIVYIPSRGYILSILNGMSFWLFLNTMLKKVRTTYNNVLNGVVYILLYHDKKLHRWWSTTRGWWYYVRVRWPTRIPVASTTQNNKRVHAFAWGSYSRLAVQAVERRIVDLPLPVAGGWINTAARANRLWMSCVPCTCWHWHTVWGWFIHWPLHTNRVDPSTTTDLNLIDRAA